MVLLPVRPQVITDNIGREFHGQPERCGQRDPAFGPVGNGYDYHFHVCSSRLHPGENLTFRFRQILRPRRWKSRFCQFYRGL
jgi:hypothetical protein